MSRTASRRDPTGGKQEKTQSADEKSLNLSATCRLCCPIPFLPVEAVSSMAVSFKRPFPTPGSSERNWKFLVCELHIQRRLRLEVFFPFLRVVLLVHRPRNNFCLNSIQEINIHCQGKIALFCLRACLSISLLIKCTLCGWKDGICHMTC